MTPCVPLAAHAGSRPSPTFVRSLATSAVAAVLALCHGAASAQAAATDWPTKPVKWVVPYPPAGTTDVLARIVAQWLTEKLGQTFLIDNKPGAGNNIGVKYVVDAPPDGYTMLLVNPANGINATLYKSLNFNFIRDIEPVAGLVSAHMAHAADLSPQIWSLLTLESWLRQTKGVRS